MSVPGLSPVGADLATLLRLSGHGPLAAASASNIAAAAIAAAEVQTTVPNGPLAPSDLALLAPGEAPDDASIGLYSAEIGAPANLSANAEAALALEFQATALLDDQLLMQEIDANNLAKAMPSDLGAAAEIDKSISGTPPSALHSIIAQDALNLFQAVEAGDAANAAAVAARLQPGLASLGASAAPALAAPATAGEPPAMLSQLQSLVASASSGDMTAAAAIAQAIKAQVQSAAPPETFSPLLMQMLAPATGLPIFGCSVDPMLMAMQWSLLLGAKATLDRLRKLREDRMRVLAVAPFGGLHEDETREERVSRAVSGRPDRSGRYAPMALWLFFDRDPIIAFRQDHPLPKEEFSDERSRTRRGRLISPTPPPGPKTGPGRPPKS